MVDALLKNPDQPKEKKKEMKRILFIDDDEYILQGLRRILREIRFEWETEFTNTGQKALEILEDSHYDIVVSDIRMPGMDGAQLLSEVKSRYPHIMRIILSAHSDQAALLKSIDVAHQFLTKPFNAKSLKTILTRAASLRQIMEDSILKELISSIESIPAMPGVYQQIMTELNSPNASLSRIGDIISKDVGMTARILQMIHSPYFGCHSKITTTKQAVVMLGLDTIKTLMLTTHVFSQFKGLKFKHFNIDEVMSHSMKTGTLAAEIVEQEGGSYEMADEARIAGFLHDCGKLLLANTLGKKYSEILELAFEKRAPLWQIEYDMLQISHAEVGAYLLGLWGLPDTIVEILAFHHHPDDCLQDQSLALISVVAANLIVHEQDPAESDSFTLEISEHYLKKIGLAERLSVWRESYQVLDVDKEKEEKEGIRS